MQKTWTVEKKERLDSFLRHVLPQALVEMGVDGEAELSNSKIRRLIMAGAVSVNGRQCRIPAYDLFPRSKVQAVLDQEKIFFEKKPDDIDFKLTQTDVLYEDQYIIAVNKPAFLPTEATIVKDRGNLHQCVVDYLWSKNPSLRNPPYAGIMHRLDRETSGVVLFTKSREANPSIHSQFESHTIEKKYLALCSVTKKNAFTSSLPEEFSVKDYMARISPKSQTMKMGFVPESRGGQFSHTDFRVLRQSSLESHEIHGPHDSSLLLVECTLHTGRTHQIRLHLSSVGLAICGDQLYGGDSGFESLGGRIMLHAESLSIDHPATGQRLTIKAPVPQGFQI